MPTYNRFPKEGWMVEEAINSFLIQDYPDKELIVCNDAPNQLLSFNHPSVIILNVPKRFNSLSEKIRYMIGNATGDVFCRWDDDDICFPWRLSMSVKNMGDKDEWRCESHFFYNGDRITHITNKPPNSHNMSIWSRKVLNKFPEGYPMHTNVMGDEDQTFNKLLRDNNYQEYGDTLDPRIIFYIYRWNISNNHLSGFPHQWYRIGKKPVEAGTFNLDPKWKTNYFKDVIKFLKEKNLHEHDRADCSEAGSL